jgi:hypothetical protein
VALPTKRRVKKHEKTFDPSLPETDLESLLLPVFRDDVVLVDVLEGRGRREGLFLRERSRGVSKAKEREGGSAE